MYKTLIASCDLIRYFPYCYSAMFSTDTFLEIDRDSPQGKELEDTLFHLRNKPKEMKDNKSGYLIRNYNGKILGFYCHDNKIFIGTLSCQVTDENNKLKWINAEDVGQQPVYAR